MPFEFNPVVRPERSRTKTIFVSIALHALVIALFIANPEWFDFVRAIHLEGEDYDLKRATMLTLPPAIPPPPAIREPLPAPLPAPPPDAVPALALPTPLPAPLPPPPPMPPVVIRPNDVIADGARPEAPPRASRGNTPDPARSGSMIPGPLLPPPAEPPAPAPPTPPAPPVSPAPKADPPALASLPGDGTPRGLIPPQIAQNANPNALRLPSLGAGLGGSRTSGSVDNAIRNAAANPPSPSSGRTGNSQGLELPNFSAEDPQILSDTRGYDFGPYLNQVVNRVRVNWYSLIPESVRFNGQRGRVVLTFTIVKSGAVQGLTLRLNSGAEPLDRAAMGSITASNPFQRLPANFEGDHLTLQFTFLYNYPAP